MTHGWSQGPDEWSAKDGTGLYLRDQESLPRRRSQKLQRKVKIPCPFSRPQTILRLDLSTESFPG